MASLSLAQTIRSVNTSSRNRRVLSVLDPVVKASSWSRSRNAENCSMAAVPIPIAIGFIGISRFSKPAQTAARRFCSRRLRRNKEPFATAPTKTVATAQIKVQVNQLLLNVQLPRSGRQSWIHPRAKELARIWRAVTCYRFGHRRPVAVVLHHTRVLRTWSSTLTAATGRRRPKR